jgi:hypothetical protein
MDSEISIKGNCSARVRMPSKLDPHIAAIASWLAEQPQLTAIAIVGRLREKYPEEFGTKASSAN